MRSIELTLIFILFISTLSAQAIENRESFNEIWAGASADPYPMRSTDDPKFKESPQELPQYEVSLSRFYDPKKWWDYTNVDLLVKAAKRTMTTKNHLLDFGGPKLVHANGACLAGEWHITRQAGIDSANPYTGGFQKGAVGRVIGRVSAATSATIKKNPKVLTGTKAEGERAFGLAMAIFFNPGDITALVDPKQPLTQDWIATVHTIHNLGGANATYFTQVPLSNKPILPNLVQAVLNLRLLVQTGIAFKKANREPTERQVYPISYIGMHGDKSWDANTPTEMIISGLENSDADDGLKNRNQVVERDDFRDEVRPELREDGHLYFGIYLRNRLQTKGTYVGYVDFDKYVSGLGCDQHLHFPHAKWLTGSI